MAAATPRLRYAGYEAPGVCKVAAPQLQTVQENALLALRPGCNPLPRATTRTLTRWACSSGHDAASLPACPYQDGMRRVKRPKMRHLLLSRPLRIEQSHTHGLHELPMAEGVNPRIRRQLCQCLQHVRHALHQSGKAFCTGAILVIGIGLCPIGLDMRQAAATRCTVPAAGLQ